MTGRRRTTDMTAFLSLALLTRFHDRGQWLRTPSWQTPNPQGGFLPRATARLPVTVPLTNATMPARGGPNMEPPEPCFLVLSLHVQRSARH